MEKKPIFLGTVAYTLVTFPLAVVWHIVLFKPLYESFGYFGGEPNFFLGFISIFIQGVILSVGYAFTTFRGGSVASGLKYSLMMGSFFWTCHVIAFLAKNVVSDSGFFFGLETLYLSFQFGIYGILIGKIYGKSQT